MIGRSKNLSEKQERVLLAVRGSGSQRLDHYLGATLPWKSRTRIQELIHAARVTVNGSPAKPSRKVRAGDEIVVELAPDMLEIPDYDDLPLDVIYEDPWLVAVNKPPGLLVHPVGRHVYDTLINYLHHRYRDAVDEYGNPLRLRLCHRIDKETTGVVVVGKDTQVHDDVRRQFEGRRVSKEYYAIVCGDFPGDEAIEIPIGEGHDLPSSLAHPVLKPSRTEVHVVSRLAGYTLLSCVPRTGRQNQIRIHVAARGFPIVGDLRFGRGPSPEGFPPRYLLHSRAIGFHHPRLKSRIELRAPLPPDFSQLLERPISP